MMGRPGSGKGTQAKLLAEKISGQMYSSGSDFRALAASDAYLGKRIKAAMEAGELLPHWLASYLYEKTLFGLNEEDVIVFEGACRTEPEAVLFHEIAEWLPRTYMAIDLVVSDEETRKRLAIRHEARADDGEAVINHRIEQYKEKTKPAIEYFRSQGRLIEINGEQSVEAVHADILKALQLS